MSLLLPALLLSAAFDGDAALRHASALAALGPHPLGSPRGAFAAEYVEAQFRQAGLDEVRRQAFSFRGASGANVIGVLRAAGPEIVVVGAHHDTVAGSPGAYDDGGGIGVLIEAARALAQSRTRSRTLLFVSFDGEEERRGDGGPPGSRTFVESLGPERTHVVAALIVEMCGWTGGTPVLRAVPYPDPTRPGHYVIAPGWAIQAALDGARSAGAPVALGDPLYGWFYQPVIRTFRRPRYTDDRPFLQAGVPALSTSDSTFSTAYPWQHDPGDTADKLDADSLARMGRAVVGIVGSVEQAPRGPAVDPSWYVAFGRVIGGGTLLAAGLLALVPGLLRALASGGFAFAVRVLQALLTLVLLWRHPVPALWVLLLPSLVTAVTRRWWASLPALAPAIGLAAVGVVGWQRGTLRVWLRPAEILIAGFALALLWVGRPGKPARRTRRKKK